MAEAGWTPTNVRDRLDHNPPDIVLVGDPATMLGDGSDATYAYRANSETINGPIIADFPPWTLGKITSINLTMRIMNGSENADTRFGVFAGDYGSEVPFGDWKFFLAGDDFGGDMVCPADDTPHTLAGFSLCDPVTSTALSMDQVNAAFADGFSCSIARRLASGTGGMTVYLMAFQIVYIPNRIPNRRQWPAQHTRIWPPVTSPQVSTRGGSAAPL